MPDKIPLKLLFLRAMLVLFGLAALGSIAVLGFSRLFGAPQLAHETVATIATPGGRLTAVLTRIVSDKGDSGYLVDVTAPDGESERVANFYAVRKADGTAGLDMAWRGDHALELHYQRATVARLDQSDLTLAGEHLIVALKPQ